MFSIFKSENNKLMAETAYRLLPMIQASHRWNKIKYTLVSGNVCTPKDIQRIESGISQFVAIEYVSEFSTHGKQMRRKKLLETINRVTSAAMKGLPTNPPIVHQ